MSGKPANKTAIWDTWLRLYPLYSTLARECAMDADPCRSLEEALEAPPAEAFSEAERWFEQMDMRIHIHHLRHFAQTSSLMTVPALADLLFHYWHKQQRNDEDRDKVDFLSVQLFSMRAPARIPESDVTLASVARVLEPVLGPASEEPPAFFNQLEDLILEADRNKNLNGLFTSRIIERSREIKVACGGDFFEPAAMAAFARFGFLIRRNFFRLMQQDLNAILDGLRELENRGVATIDCRRAQFGAEEPIIRIRMICHSWRVMFQAEYSSGQPLCLLVDLRTAVETALAQSAKSAPAAAAGSASNPSVTAGAQTEPSFALEQGKWNDPQ
jgi:hypothetical protein